MLFEIHFNHRIDNNHTMSNSSSLKALFREYLSNCVQARRTTDDSSFIIGRTTVDSYVNHAEVDKLFDYAPEKWSHISSIYDIESSAKILDIIKELTDDKDFRKKDKGTSQYFRSNAIKQYYCFLRAREIFKSEETAAQTNTVPKSEQTPDEFEPLQQIFYGAPGTGKSHEIKEKTATAEKEGRVIRTTFHPDSDYSTFVGAYKPTSIDVPVMTIIDKEQVPVVNAKPEKRIVYEFVPQAFLKAYTGAWKNQDKPFYLIIEEINRGNCAQIFGDLFQLLDRNDEGVSEYPISPDEDIQKFLLTNSKYGFADLTEEQKASIPEKIRSGQTFKLPKNLHIWATMNTSDQSLFPIDSAFKRRWDWKYSPIVNAEKDWKIEVNGKRYDWWAFLEKVNDKIYSTTKSEDKKMGYFFCKPHNGIIDAETFVGKLIFYIWNDVFKDFVDEAGDLFKDADNSQLSFNKFYTGKGSESTGIAKDKVELFLKNLKLDAEQNITEDLPVLDENGNDTTGSSNSSFDFSKYSINGTGNYSKGMTVFRCLELYADQNKNLSANEVVDTWLSLGIKVPNLVETNETHISRRLSTKDARFDEKSKELVLSNGETIFVSNQFNVDRINDFISKVNAQSWGIHIEKA